MKSTSVTGGEAGLADAAKLTRFETTVLVHFDAGYNLARWLTRDEFGAQDAMQNACLRAFRFFDNQHGPNPKAWFMAVVRNASLDWLKDQRRHDLEEPYDDDAHGAGGESPESPDSAAERESDASWVHDCIAALPREYREVVVLRELEELSYKEISAIVEVPIGTVMSRLARGRDLLQRNLAAARRRQNS
jgi:RNA polymerase sigma-70 factor (ECF subfamily)